MADIRRPHTSLGYHTPVQYVDTDTKIADDFVLAPGFRKTLSEYYPKATAQDKARCIELLTSLDIGDAIKEAAKDIPPQQYPYQPASYVQKEKQRRPKSAMPFSSSDRVGPRADITNPYTTSYERDYPIKASSPTQADRPQTIAGRAYQASHELSGPIGGTTYQYEFHGFNKHLKNQEHPTTQIRSGTASGDRRNNPHPLESFIVWKLPRKVTRDGGHGSLGQELTDDLMDKVCRGQLTTTYQTDYLGIPQGYPLDDVFTISAPDWKSKVPYTLNSSSRKSFQKPCQKEELKGNTSRYGCNKNKHIPANGIAPTVPRRHMFNLKTRTTYEREYNDPMGPKPTQVRDLGKEYGAQSLQRYMPRAEGTDQRTIEEMLKSMNLSTPGHPRTPVRVPSATPRSPCVRIQSRTPSSMRPASLRPTVLPTTEVTSPLPEFQPGMTGFIDQAAY